jgi:enoyl-CoA hydratase/carnithine racemase
VPQLNVRLIRRATYQGERSDLSAALDLISSHMAIVSSTSDAKEALAAFKERRPGIYLGR